MVDRTEEDILQDQQLETHAAHLTALQSQVDQLAALVTALAPLQGLAERVAEIEAFFERQGLKAFPERKA